MSRQASFGKAAVRLEPLGPSTILYTTIPSLTQSQLLQLDKDICDLRAEVESLRDEIVIMRREQAMFRGVIEKGMTRTGDEEVINLRVIPVSEAKPLVEEYVKNHPDCWTSDIAIGLGIDVGVVLKSLEELQNERKVRGTDP